MSVENRWALLHKEGGFLLGRYSWPGVSKNDIKVPTFRTRMQARRKKKELGEFSEKCAKVVKVEVIIRVIDK